MQLSRAVIVAALLAIAVPAAASGEEAETEAAPTLEMCAESFDQCIARCAARNPDSAAAQAGCEARCTTDRATCEAKAGYEEAKPWVREQMQKLRDFFRGFGEGPEGTPPPTEEVPSPKTPGERDGDAPDYKNI